MPWCATSGGAAFRSTAWDCKCTSAAHLHADIASISANIDRFTALGVQVHITEMDVALPVDANGNASAGGPATASGHLSPDCRGLLSHPRCTAIQTWGFTDKYSWIGSHSKKTQGAALPFDRNYRTKPAYEALRQTLFKESVAVVRRSADGLRV